MIQIKCTLQNASTEINGIKFEDVDGVMVSEPVKAEVADQFRGINGYELVGADGKAPKEVVQATEVTEVTETTEADQTPETGADSAEVVETEAAAGANDSADQTQEAPAKAATKSSRSK